MSVKRDESGRRWVAAEVEVPGTPEEVWKAIATGEGVSSWFVPTEKRADGTVVSHFGPGMDAVAVETAWDPPRRFAAESEMAPGGPKIATEWIVEALSGGKCLVRVVHSLFASTDDWDDQLEAVESGWPGYFQILKLYLAHFRGLPCSMFQLMGMAPEPASKAWDVIADALGFSGVVVGERRQAAAGAPPFGGLVESAGDAGHPWAILVRLDQPTTGLANLFALGMGGQVYIAARFYLYGDQAAAIAARDEPKWQAWLKERFPVL